MSTLWGSKKDDNTTIEPHPNGGDSSTSHVVRDSDDIARMREPTERDRLLPADTRRPLHADGYLDPDDPAVSELQYDLTPSDND
jgi:hypothetical protein